MSGRRVDDAHLHEFDSALRSALRSAMESVEPGEDGLDHIRTKIAARQSARRKLGWRNAALPGTDGSWWRAFLPPPGWLPALVAAVVERFRPDPLRAGWFGWLRPAAAVVTGLFVVTAASWAVAALPSVILGSPGSSAKMTTSQTPTHHKKSTSVLHYSSGNSGGTGTSGSTHATRPGQNGGSHPSTPSCSPTVSGSPSGSPTSGSPSVSGSPSSGSPSLSTSPTSTSPSLTTPPSSPSVGATTPGGTASPTANRPPGPSTSPDATGKALLSPDAVTAALLAGTDPTPGPTSSPTVSGPPTPTPTSTAPTPCA